MVHLVTKVKSRIDPESLSRELQLSQSNTLRKAAAAISDGAHGAMVQLNITYKAQYTTEDVITGMLHAGQVPLSTY
jgi:hypothetical protein